MQNESYPEDIIGIWKRLNKAYDCNEEADTKHKLCQPFCYK